MFIHLVKRTNQQLLILTNKVSRISLIKLSLKQLHLLMKRIAQRMQMTTRIKRIIKLN